MHQDVFIPQSKILNRCGAIFLFLFPGHRRVGPDQTTPAAVPGATDGSHRALANSRAWDPNFPTRAEAAAGAFLLYISHVYIRLYHAEIFKF